MGFFNRNKENKPKYDRVKGIGKAGALAGGLAGAATGLYNGKGLGKSLLYGLGGAAAGGIAGSVAGKIHNNAEKRDFEDRVKSGDTNPGGDYEERKRRRMKGLLLAGGVAAGAAGLYALGRKNQKKMKLDTINELYRKNKNPGVARELAKERLRLKGKRVLNNKALVGLIGGGTLAGLAGASLGADAYKNYRRNNPQNGGNNQNQNGYNNQGNHQYYGNR